MQTLLANYPALMVFNPAAYDSAAIQLDQDKGYCRTSSACITLKGFPGDKYEYIRNFYFGEADGEYFCNPVAAMITAEKRPTKVTFGYELGDVVTVDGRKFELVQAANKNIKLVEVE